MQCVAVRVFIFILCFASWATGFMSSFRGLGAEHLDTAFGEFVCVVTYACVHSRVILSVYGLCTSSRNLCETAAMRVGNGNDVEQRAFTRLEFFVGSVNFLRVRTYVMFFA